MLTQEELAALHREAEIELKKYPGVVGVGYGLRERGGVTTDEVAFRVYVREKKGVAELGPDEVIPPEFKGIPTDVIKLPTSRREACEDTDTYSPLVSGITISNMRQGPQGVKLGTLGFFATINGQEARENIVLVSNHHILTALGAAVGDTIYQPAFMDQGGTPVVDITPGRERPVADILSVGLIGNHSFAYPSEAAADFGVDAASAKLRISISSWCGSNCGVSYKNAVQGLNLGDGRIADVERVTAAQIQPGQPDYVVRKRGRTTGLTVGKVIDVAGVVHDPDINTDLQRLLLIEATENNCNGVMQFTNSGDSGSPIINADRKLVGLHIGSDTANPSRSYACHIHPVMDLLGIAPITSANPPVGPAGRLFADAPGALADGVDHTERLKQKLLGTERGREIFELVLAHRLEIIELVNHRRPVTVAWHRSKGPAFFAHALQSARDPSHAVPREVEGVTREALIRNMARAFAEHGGPELKALVGRHLGEALARADGFDRLHELVEHVEEFELV
jgi:hypothetical protein